MAARHCNGAVLLKYRCNKKCDSYRVGDFLIEVRNRQHSGLDIPGAMPLK